MQQNERLSAYMDGCLSGENFADEINADVALKQKWAAYHTIRSVMRGEEQLLGADFSAKMEALLENEEIETAAPAQAQKAKRGRVLQLKKWATPLLQAGIAASVCLVAVLGFNAVSQEEETAQNDQPVMLTLPFSNAVQQVSYNAPSQLQPNEERLEYQQRLLNSLLQNHELQRRTNVNNGVVMSEAQKAQSQTSAAEPQNQPLPPSH